MLILSLLYSGDPGLYPSPFSDKGVKSLLSAGFVAAMDIVTGCAVRSALPPSGSERISTPRFIGSKGGNAVVEKSGIGTGSMLLPPIPGSPGSLPPTPPGSAGSLAPPPGSPGSLISIPSGSPGSLPTPPGSPGSLPPTVGTSLVAKFDVRKLVGASVETSGAPSLLPPGSSPPPPGSPGSSGSLSLPVGAIVEVIVNELVGAAVVGISGVGCGSLSLPPGSPGALSGSLPPPPGSPGSLPPPPGSPGSGTIGTSVSMELGRELGAPVGAGDGPSEGLGDGSSSSSFPPPGSVIDTGPFGAGSPGGFPPGGLPPPGSCTVGDPGSGAIGLFDGVEEGSLVGRGLGRLVGASMGVMVGRLVGKNVGLPEGLLVGRNVGLFVGGVVVGAFVEGGSVKGGSVKGGSVKGGSVFGSATGGSIFCVGDSVGNADGDGDSPGGRSWLLEKAGGRS